MKTRDLIDYLQKVDPSGELECCIGNADIYTIYTEAAYWDGCLQVLIRDPNNEFYNVIGAKYVLGGKKVVIRSLSISDAIFNDENLPVTYEGFSKEKQEQYEKNILARRKETNEIHNQVEKEFFTSYILKRCSEKDFEEDNLKRVANNFYDEVLDHKDRMPEDILKTKKTETRYGKSYEVIPSWFERRSTQWDREIMVDLIDGDVIILKRNKYTSEELDQLVNMIKSS